jgi:hypothetical protein
MGKLTWTDWRGRECVREVNDVIRLQDFEDINPAGLALLLMAANTHLSVSDLYRLLDANGIERGEMWIRRRRWLFQPEGTVNSNSNGNADGKDERAREIMREHPTDSLRFVVRVLKEHGIHRSKDWVRRHRCE